MKKAKATPPSRCYHCNRGRPRNRPADFRYTWLLDAWLCCCGTIYLCETPGVSPDREPEPDNRVYSRTRWAQLEEET